MSTPRFSDLPEVAGIAGMRWVGGQMMDEEQYTIERWTQEHGYWFADVEGMRRYSELRRERRLGKRADWQERQETDASFREYADALEDAKPGGRP